jgi:dipeptidyl aminopeptidase/acylaminoacyl peptidase
VVLCDQRSLLPILIATIASSLGTEVGMAQGPIRALPVEAVVNAPRLAPLSSPVIAAQGDLVAYSMLKLSQDTARFEVHGISGVPWYAVNSRVMVSTLAGHVVQSFDSLTGPQWAPSWSPDGQRLAFFVASADTTGMVRNGLWVWDRRTRVLSQVGDIEIASSPGEIATPQWTAGGFILVKVRSTKKATRHDGPSRIREPSTVVVLKSTPADTHGARPGQTNPDVWTGDLAVVDGRSGETRRLVTNKRICRYLLSPDRRTVLWVEFSRYLARQSQQTLVTLGVTDIQSGRTTFLSPELPSTVPYVLLNWSPDGRHIAFRTTGTEARDDLYILALESHTITRLASQPREAWRLQAGPLWDREGKNLFLVREGTLWRVSVSTKQRAHLLSLPGRAVELIDSGTGTFWSPDQSRRTIVLTFAVATKRSGFARVDTYTGAAEQVVEESKAYNGSHTTAVASPKSDFVLYRAEDPQHPQDLWRFTGIGSPQRMTHLAPELEQAYGDVADLIQWHGLDGEILHGVLIRPTIGGDSAWYPLIVRMYPGASFSDDLNKYGYAREPIDNARIFTSRGFAVLLADSRVSRELPMLSVAKSLLPGIDKAIESGKVDPCRIGVIGHSYGGYAALALIVQSTRFRTAVVRGGFGDLVGLYGDLKPDGTTYGLPFIESQMIGANPWHARERYIENSPFYYLDRVHIPVLLIHGANDSAVHVKNADRLFVALQRLGATVEYARYSGEDHTEGQWSSANQTDFMNRTVDWFDHHLRSCPMRGSQARSAP